MSDAPIPMTLSEANVIIETLKGRGALTDRETRAIEVAMRLAKRSRAGSTSQVNMVGDLIAARTAQQSALLALDRAIGTAATSDLPAADGG